jgi:glycosyltransferase involved in cell wall biosynthesis
VLPVFVDIERFRGVQRMPDAKPLILWTGRFENEKDPMRALEIFREVLEKVPEVKMIMLGSGSLLEKTKREAEDKKLFVEFPGWQDTVPYLVRASLALSTSKAESWGASIVEALAAGVPVVAPDVGIALEAGAIVVPKEKLADAVFETLRTPPKATLNIPVLSQQEWVARWKENLA